MLFFPRCGVLVCLSVTFSSLFSLLASFFIFFHMKSKRVFGCSSQEEYEEEDLAYDTPERKKKQKGGGRSNSKVVNNNGTFFVFTSLI